MGECLGMCLVGFEVWPWHEVRGRMLWEREKMVLSPRAFGFKKELIPNWTSLVSEMSWTAPRNFPGRFPPTSEPEVRESQRSVSTSPLFPAPSVKQWTGSETGPRLVQVRALRVLTVLLAVLYWQVQQAQADGKSLAGPMSYQKLLVPSFPPPDFLLVVPFLLPPAKMELCPFMSESFPNKWFGSRLGFHSGVMLLVWKKCVTHIAHMFSVDLNPDLCFASAPLSVQIPQVLAAGWHWHQWSTADTN